MHRKPKAQNAVLEIFTIKSSRNLPILNWLNLFKSLPKLWIAVSRYLHLLMVCCGMRFNYDKTPFYLEIFSAGGSFVD